MQYSYCALQPWEALLSVLRDLLREAHAQTTELWDDSWPGPRVGAMTLQRKQQQAAHIRVPELGHQLATCLCLPKEAVE